MKPKYVVVTPGVAGYVFKENEVEQVYTGIWSLNVILFDKIYEIALFTPGKPETIAGVTGQTGWAKSDKLLLMEKLTFTDEGDDITPISQDEARELTKLLKDIKDGTQFVENQYKTELHEPYKQEIVAFLEPRIEIAARLVNEAGHVKIGEIEKVLKSNQENPPLPRS